MSTMIDEKDACIESISTPRIGVPAERGRRLTTLTSLRVGAISMVLSQKNEEPGAALVHDFEPVGDCLAAARISGKQPCW